jgi:hypothetical protein
MMRRTRFPQWIPSLYVHGPEWQRKANYANNVVNLAIKRRQAKLRKRKAERDQAKVDLDFRVGLMLSVSVADLTPAELALCVLIKERTGETGSIPATAVHALHQLLTKHLYNRQALIVHTAKIDDIDDGGGSGTTEIPRSI